MGDITATGRTWRRVRIALTTLWVALAVVVLVAVVSLKVTGWTAQVVRTGSMAPTIPQGSLVLTRPVDPADVRVGDVILFRSDRRTIMHRVTSVTAVNGTLVFHTKGDANEQPDPSPITSGAIKGLAGWHAERLGDVAPLLLPPRGYVLLIGLPLAYLVATEVMRATTRRRIEPDDAPAAD